MIKLIKAIIAEARKQHGYNIAVDISNNPTGVKQSRNSQCSCGSGKKYKRCCGKK